MPIRFEVDDHVARVTIDRPEVLNAVDAAAEARAAAHLGRDRGRPRRPRRRAHRRRRPRLLRRRRHEGRQRRVRPRVLGACRGPAASAASRCARRSTCRSSPASTATPSAAASRWCSAATSSSRPRRRRFGLPEARVGRLPLDGGMALLQRQIPFRQAMGVLLTGRRISAAEALAHRPRQRGRAARPSSTRRSSAGWPTSWPARRSRCAPSSRSCAAPRISPPRRRRRMRLPALVEALHRRTQRRACAPSSRSASPSGRGARRCPM